MSKTFKQLVKDILNEGYPDNMDWRAFDNMWRDEDKDDYILDNYFEQEYAIRSDSDWDLDKPEVPPVKATQPLYLIKNEDGEIVLTNHLEGDPTECKLFLQGEPGQADEEMKTMMQHVQSVFPDVKFEQVTVYGDETKGYYEYGNSYLESLIDDIASAF